MMSDDGKSDARSEPLEHASEDGDDVHQDGAVATPAELDAAATAPAGAAAPSPPQDATPQTSTRRKRKAPIDIDEHIAAARKAMKEAQKQVSAAKTQARNERRKKQRLIKKASTLTSEDLERIAVWKRCGIDPASARVNGKGPCASSSSAGTSAASSAGSSPASRPASDPAEARVVSSMEPRPSTGAAA